MILGSSPLGSTAAQLGASYPFTDTGIMGRIIDIVGSYLPFVDMVGSYLPTLDLTGSYLPNIDIVGEANGD